MAGEIAATQTAAVPQVSTAYRAQVKSSPSANTDAAVSITNGPPLTNPSLHLDLALNLVVLQFFNSQGEVTNSIPSQKQLEAYQQDGPDANQTVSKLL